MVLDVKPIVVCEDEARMVCGCCIIVCRDLHSTIE
jgi:hypothetical protein